MEELAAASNENRPSYSPDVCTPSSLHDIEEQRMLLLKKM